MKRLIIILAAAGLLGLYVLAVIYGPHNLWLPDAPASVVVSPLPTVAPETSDAPSPDTYTVSPTPCVHYNKGQESLAKLDSKQLNIPVCPEPSN